jgi:hypothetical protein
MALPQPPHVVDSAAKRFKLFHELMPRKVGEILLISTPYEAWIMEEDCRLSERIVSEYRGLNLSNPPRLTWVSTLSEALSILAQRRIDLVIIMEEEADRSAFAIREKLRETHPSLMVALLTHQPPPQAETSEPWRIGDIKDAAFVWSGDTNLLLAMIKGAEDFMNLAHDTATAGIRIIILVEDSPQYMSAILPILYKQLLIQTQEVMEQGLNEEHRLLTMRARPKIIISESYEEAWDFFRHYEAYVLGVISDTRIPRGGIVAATAGVDLLKKINARCPDIPLLLYSAEVHNAQRAATIPAAFIDKNSPALFSEVRAFLVDHLGFGEFVFREPDGYEVARAKNLWGLERGLHQISDDAFGHHCRQNDFSRWLFARSEIELATRIRGIREPDFESTKHHRDYLISLIRSRRMGRQKGIVVNFDPQSFDTDTEFFKIGKGSLGGKARGLAYMAALIHGGAAPMDRFGAAAPSIPQTLVITTEAFDAFVEANRLKPLSRQDLPDPEVAARFRAAEIPLGLEEQLRAYLSVIRYPLAVRSSSLLEDARFRAHAGLYRTYMLPNSHKVFEERFEQLVDAIKLVYASTYFQGPKAYSRRVGQRTEEEKMAVIIQALVGSRHKSHLYPSISGVAQSHNYYPFSTMTPEEGIATIALGLGKAVMGGEKTLRFSPARPHIQPQLSSVAERLDNAQRYFYALAMAGPPQQLEPHEDPNLVKREIADAEDEPPVRTLAGTYVPQEDRIRDTVAVPGARVVTFHNVLKYGLFPLAEMLKEILAMGQSAMGCPVEIEFALDLNRPDSLPASLALLQIRPMSSREEMLKVDITEAEVGGAVCVSSQALGNTISTEIADIVYVKPDTFDPAQTLAIAREVGKMNTALDRWGRKYLLVGPGRWGSTDRWLGIPVSWADICGVGAMIETAHPKLRAEPSQGSHFFHNITSLGITYFTVLNMDRDRLDWTWFTALPLAGESAHVAHARLAHPLTLKVDGRSSAGVVLPPPASASPPHGISEI